MSMNVHRRVAQAIQCRSKLMYLLALGVMLGMTNLASGQKLQSYSTPVMIPVQLGEVDGFISPGTAEAEERAIAIALDVVAAAIRSRNRAPVVLEVTDYPVRYADLSARQKAAVAAAIPTSSDAQTQYEAAIAWQLRRAIELARDSQPAALYSVAELPLDPEAFADAHGTNANYLTALDVVDVMIAPQSMILMNNKREGLMRLSDLLARTGVPLRERPLLCRINNRWHAATGVKVTGAAVQLVAPVTTTPEEHVQENVQTDVTKDSPPDPTEAMREMFESVLDQGGDTPLDQILAAWGSGEAQWDLNEDEVIDVQDLLRLLALWDEFQKTDSTPDDNGNDDPTDEPGIARFSEMITIYEEGTTGSLSIEMLAGAPANPNVVFQTWSATAGGLQAPLVDREPPFVYPGAALDQVADGNGEIQAVIRNSADEVITVVKMPVMFLMNNSDDTDGTGDDTTDTGGDTTDTTDGGDDTTDTGGDDTTDTGGDDTDGGTGGGSAPEPAISIIDTEGQAPFTVHVHGLDTQLHRGDELTALYSWDFGDPTGTYNTLIGWNAAHTYNTPGTYIVSLTVTDELGVSATETVSVTVHANTRQKIYVSSGGNDANDGSTEAKAVRTLARAVQMMSNNTEIRIRRGSSYNVSSSLMLDNENVLITSYGSGSIPTLWWTGPSSTYSALLEMNNDSRDIVIERIKFDAPSAAAKMSVRGIMPDGVNITVRNCTFGKVSDAHNNERKPTGVLIQDNYAGAIGAYFSWSQGTDFSIIGNTVEDSVAEHNIRFGGVDRGLVYGNSLTNTFKSCLWCMNGTYAYVTGNEFNEGPVTIGPNEAEGDPDARLHWAVVEQNTHQGQGFRAHSGAEHVVYRNNAVHYNDKSAFTISGTNTSFGRTANDIRIINNTATNESARGRFLEVTSHADGVLVANNMYVAPNLETGSSKTANVYIIDSDMSEYTFKNNLWTTPKVIGWGDGWHYMYDYWSNSAGYLDMSEWGAMGTVHGDSCSEFAGADVLGAYDAEFEKSNAVGVAQPGLHTDLNGTPRPLAGPVRAGAVED